MLIYVRMNLDILNRDVDYSSIVNPMFELEDEEEPELPSAWHMEADVTDDGQEEPEPPPAATRAAVRTAVLTANKAAAEQGAQRAVLVTEATEGRRAVRRPTTYKEI